MGQPQPFLFADGKLKHLSAVHQQSAGRFDINTRVYLTKEFRFSTSFDKLKQLWKDLRLLTIDNVSANYPQNTRVKVNKELGGGFEAFGMWKCQ